MEGFSWNLKAQDRSARERLVRALIAENPAASPTDVMQRLRALFPEAPSGTTPPESTGTSVHGRLDKTIARLMKELLGDSLFPPCTSLRLSLAVSPSLSPSPPHIIFPRFARQ